MSEHEHTSPPLADMNKFQRDLDEKKRDEAGETIAAVNASLVKTLTGRYPQAATPQRAIAPRQGK